MWLVLYFLIHHHKHAIFDVMIDFNGFQTSHFCHLKNLCRMVFFNRNKPSSVFRSAINREIFVSWYIRGSISSNITEWKSNWDSSNETKIENLKLNCDASAKWVYFKAIAWTDTANTMDFFVIWPTWFHSKANR